MATIVYQIDKKTGTKYAYSSEPYWDKNVKRPRSKRTYLGKVDPETGEIIPKKDAKFPAKDPEGAETSGEQERLSLQLKEALEENRLLKKEIEELRELCRQAAATLSRAETVK